MPTTGTPGWPRPISALSGAERPATVQTIHNIAFQGKLPARLLGRVASAAEAFRLEGVEYYGQIGVVFLKAGLHFARSHHDREPDLRARDPDTRARHGPRRLAAPSRPAAHGDPERHRRDSLEPRPGPAYSVALSATPGWRTRHPTRPSCGHACRAGWQRRRSRCFALSVGLPTRKAWIWCWPPCRICWRGGANWPCWEPARPGSRHNSAPPRRRRRAVSPASLTMTRSSAHLFQAGADAILMPSRFEALRPPRSSMPSAMERYRWCCARRRARRHGDRRQRGGAERRRCHRVSVCAADRGGAAYCSFPHVRPVRPACHMAAGPASRHDARGRLAATGRTLRRAVCARWSRRGRSRRAEAHGHRK